MLRPDLIISVRRYNVWYDNDDIEHRELTDEITDYTCESIHVNFDGTVTFFCSGRPYTIPQEDVRGVKFFASGASWCPFCDQSIEHFRKG